MRTLVLCIGLIKLHSSKDAPLLPKGKTFVHKNNILILFFLNLILFNSCEDFSVLQKDQEDLNYFKNTSTVTTSFQGELSIATFNIKFGFCQTCDPFRGEIGGDPVQLDRIATFINEQEIDIIALQEVGHEYDLIIVQNQIEYLAEKTNMNYAYGMARAIQTGDNLFINGFQGNAILSKYPIESNENHKIRYIDYNNQNNCLETTIKLSSSKKITILNTHFEPGTTNEEKDLQVHNILNIIVGNENDVFLTGDFNMGINGVNNHLKPVESHISNSLFHIPIDNKNILLNEGTFIKGYVLDYIYLDTTKYEILDGYLAPEIYRDISDHYPYILKLKSH